MSLLVPLVMRKQILETAIREELGRLGAMGGQKVIVTSRYGGEVDLPEPLWTPVLADGSRPVMISDNIEFGVFDHRCAQDRHYHRLAMECYTVLGGTMLIEVAENIYSLAPGDSIVVPPPLPHQVLRTSPFLAQVILTNCYGPADKYTLP
ncbi:MAG: cupin domain-containing protein [Bryobacteraceae bacterium]|nr:cupin domain-containing protein [Bryobacteraceae bacterium]